MDIRDFFYTLWKNAFLRNCVNEKSDLYNIIPFAYLLL